MLIMPKQVKFGAKTHIGQIKKVWVNFNKFLSKIKNIQSPLKKLIYFILLDSFESTVLP